MNKVTLRKTMVETLGLLVERYPNLRIGQIIGNLECASNLYYVDDAELARSLNQLFVSYTQLEAAGVMKP